MKMADQALEEFQKVLETGPEQQDRGRLYRHSHAEPEEVGRSRNSGIRR